MIDYIDTNGLNYKYQSGYRKHHLTTTALLNISDDICVNMNNNKSTVLVLLEFSKAFDSIGHTQLLHKLREKFEFSTSACSLIKSYLMDRYQCVTIGKETSTFIPIKSGVPQGSVLGPLLFCLYISDINSFFDHSSTHNYADEVQIYRSCSLDEKSVQSFIGKINSDLARVILWASENSLNINVSKSKSIVIYKTKINTILTTLILF